MSFFSDGVDPRLTCARFAEAIADNLGLACRSDKSGDAHELIGSRCRILINAVDHLPAADLRLSARRTVARDNALAAVIVFHPAWDLGWTTETRAYVAFPQAGSIVAADMLDASVGWNSESLEFLSCDGNRRLYVGARGSQLLDPASDRAWANRRAAAALVWQDAISRVGEAA